jgi:hypothetical protein
VCSGLLSASAQWQTPVQTPQSGTESALPPSAPGGVEFRVKLLPLDFKLWARASGPIVPSMAAGNLNCSIMMSPGPSSTKAHMLNLGVWQQGPCSNVDAGVTGYYPPSLPLRVMLIRGLLESSFSELEPCQ